MNGKIGFFVVSSILFFLLPYLVSAAEGPNLIANPSFETPGPQSWKRGSYGTNNTVFTYPAAGSDSSPGAKIEVSNYSSGDAKWFFNDTPVTSGKEYRFSHYYQASSPNIITLQYKKPDGSSIYREQVLSAAPLWQQTTLLLKVPDGVSSFTAYHALRGAGSLSLDNYELREIIPDTVPPPPPPPTPTPPPPAPIPPPPAPTPQNLVLNPSFETGSTSSGPASWARGRYGTNTATFLYPVTGRVTPRAAEVQISSYSTGDAKWYMNDIAVTPGDTYTISDYFKSTTQSFVVLRLRTPGGSYLYQDIANMGAASTWQKFEQNFTIPQGVTSLTVFHLIKSVGSLTIDDASIIKTTSTNQSLFDQGFVSLNFDDGWQSIYRDGLAILNEKGFKSTQYIVTRAIDTKNYVTRAEVLDMQTRGHEIGAHTRNHRDVTTLSPEELQNEIVGSRSDLLAMGINTVSTFAYPYGKFNAAADTVVRSAGFQAARTSQGGLNQQNADRYFLKVRSVEALTTLDQVKAWLSDARTTKSWLILMFHQIDRSGSQYSTTPERLREIIDYISAQNIPVVTNAEAIKLLK